PVPPLTEGPYLERLEPNLLGEPKVRRGLGSEPSGKIVSVENPDAAPPALRSARLLPLPSARPAARRDEHEGGDGRLDLERLGRPRLVIVVRLAPRVAARSELPRRWASRDPGAAGAVLDEPV